MLDGLLPNLWVTAAISDSISSSPSDTLPLAHVEDDSNVLAFLAEFMPYCDMHYLLPVDVPPSDFLSVSEVLAATMSGSLEPEWMWIMILCGLKRWHPLSRSTGSPVPKTRSAASRT